MKDNSKERILICREGAIGDVMHTLPLVKYLKSKFKNSSIEYLTSGNICEVLEKHCPYIDQTWTYVKGNEKDIAVEILENGKKVDYFFNLHSTFRFSLFNNRYIKARKYFQHRADKNLHVVLNFAKTFDASISAFNLNSSTLHISDVRDLLNQYNLHQKNYICLVPGVGKHRTSRGWPLQNWLDLASKILSLRRDYKVVFLGGSDESGIKPQFSNFEQSKSLNLIDELSLSDTARIISASACLVSCDTGLLHLASALSVKVIGLFGSTKFSRTGPYATEYVVMDAKNCTCKLFGLKTCWRTRENFGYCMNSIGVDEVLLNVGKLTFSETLLSI